MKIEVRISFDEFQEIQEFTNKYDNDEMGEEQYIEELFSAIGHRFQTIPQTGDQIAILVVPRTQVSTRAD